MKKLIIFFILLNSCANMNAKKDYKIEAINLNENLSFIECKNKFIKYGQESDYPNIN